MCKCVDFIVVFSEKILKHYFLKVGGLHCSKEEEWSTLDDHSVASEFFTFFADVINKWP